MDKKEEEEETKTTSSDDHRQQKKKRLMKNSEPGQFCRDRTILEMTFEPGLRRERLRMMDQIGKQVFCVR